MQYIVYCNLQYRWARSKKGDNACTSHKEMMRMKSNVKDLPIAHEALGEMIRGQDWGGMTSAYMQYPTGLDFTPLLKGLERDHCQCPHWGFVIEGSIRVNYVGEHL